MRILILIIILGTVSSCSTMTKNDFKDALNVHKNKSEKFERLTNKHVSIFPNERIETVGNEVSYEGYLSLPLSFKKCNIEVYHEVTRYRSRMKDAILRGIFTGSLGIIPYISELSFKTRLTLSSSAGSASKEIASEKIDVRSGIVFIPLFIGELANSKVHLTNNITALMYALQVSKLAVELKDFKCD